MTRRLFFQSLAGLLAVFGVTRKPKQTPIGTRAETPHLCPRCQKPILIGDAVFFTGPQAAVHRYPDGRVFVSTQANGVVHSHCPVASWPDVSFTGTDADLREFERRARAAFRSEV